MLTLQAWVMSVAQDAAQDATATSARPYSSFPMAEHRITPKGSVTEDGKLPPTSEADFEQAVASPFQGSGTGTGAAAVGMRKGDAEKIGSMKIVDITADASSAADLTLDKR